MSHKFIPHSDEDIRKMLDKIGVLSVFFLDVLLDLGGRRVKKLGMRKIVTQSLEEGGVVGYQLGFVVAVLRLPFHESLKFRGDGASLALGKVGYHAEGIVAE